MRPWRRGLYLIAVLGVAFVAVSTIVAAVRQGSWSPIIAVGWLPAVVIATWPGSRSRCLPRRRNLTG
jgi:uncharacterized membrane protein